MKKVEVAGGSDEEQEEEAGFTRGSHKTWHRRRPEMKACRTYADEASQRTM